MAKHILNCETEEYLKARQREIAAKTERINATFFLNIIEENKTMSKTNSRERIVVGTDAVKRYNQIANKHHNKEVAIFVTKKVFLLTGRDTVTNIDIWCDKCDMKFYTTLHSFLKAHGIED